MQRQFTQLRRLIPLMIGAVALILVGAACSSESNEPETGAAVPTAVDGAITIVARDNYFETKAFSAPADTPIRVTLDNKGAALHNFALVGQKGPDGQEIQTKLIPGGQQDSVTFSLPAGTYEYYCTVHPQMRGTLTVS